MMLFPDRAPEDGRRRVGTVENASHRLGARGLQGLDQVVFVTSAASRTLRYEHGFRERRDSILIIECRSRSLLTPTSKHWYDSIMTD
jgi:hypothetical protein